MSPDTHNIPGISHLRRVKIMILDSPKGDYTRRKGLVFCTYIYIYTYVCIHICTYIWPAVRPRAQGPARGRALRYMYVHICMYMYMYKCIRICVYSLPPPSSLLPPPSWRSQSELQYRVFLGDYANCGQEAFWQS